MRQALPTHYAKILYELTRELDPKSANLDQVTASFAAFLKKDGAIKKIDAILAAFLAYSEKARGETPIHVTSARPLAPSIAQVLRQALGKESRIEETVDEALIGGIVVRHGDTIYDASVKGQLVRLEEAIIRS